MTVEKLHLTNYRNFADREFSFDLSISLIIGDNGTGKTNLLEAVSMLTPGKGLRNSYPEEICKYETDNWLIKALTNTKMGQAKFDIFYSKSEAKKTVQYNGSKITQTELANFTNIIWLTPQMDGLFLGAPKDRRKFLDRIVFSSFANHAQIISKYENHQKERMKILETTPDNKAWLDVIEKEMAELSISITENRLKTIGIINKNNKNIEAAFPKASLELDSEIVELLNHADPAHSICTQFQENRYRDKISNRTNFGPHKSDMRTYYASTSIPAEECSTGQQKALLISIIIAQQISHEQKPILLLDEIFVHLDDKRKSALAEFLIQNKSQVLITSTERDIQQYLGSPQVIEIAGK